MPKKREQQIALWVDVKLHRMLQELAELEDRTMAAVIRSILTEEGIRRLGRARSHQVDIEIYLSSGKKGK